MTFNRRSFERFVAPFEVAVVGCSGESWGRLANFSLDGVMLISAQKWQEDQHYKVTLKPKCTTLAKPVLTKPIVISSASIKSAPISRPSSSLLSSPNSVDIDSLDVELDCLWVQRQGSMSWVGAQFLVKDPNQIVLITSWVSRLKAGFSLI